jgi:hypothetical protein
MNLNNNILNLSPEQVTKLILIITPIVISLISFLLGYFVNFWFGVGMFVFGILVVEIPQLILYKQLTKSEESRR